MNQNEKPLYDAAVICESNDLAELLKLLLDESGFSSVRATIATLPTARFMIINLDDEISKNFLSQPAADFRHIIGITADSNKIPDIILSKCAAILCRPLSFAEFRKKVRLVFDSSIKQSVKTFPIPGQFSLDLDSSERRVSLGSSGVQLTPNEFIIFSHLVQKRGEPVSRSELALLITKNGGDALSNETDVYICTLREKLEKTFGSRLIFTVRGKGYMIK
jgi:DNA-binding response OmpR family regulator